MSKTVMMFGVGDLGGWVLEFIARREGIGKIVVADLREDWGRMKVDCAATGAGQEGYSKTMVFEKCDVSNVDATAELIKKHSPDVIYSGLTLMGWSARRAIATKITGKFRANVLVLPLQATLNVKLMQAVRESGCSPHVVNNTYPDIVNPMLCKVGLPITIGAGNLDNIVGEIRRKISVSQGVPAREVTICLISEHAVNVMGTRTGAPFYFKAMV
ncbi:hypothetical protein ACFLUE_03145, partial [Chloroflexota bacterium]